MTAATEAADERYLGLDSWGDARVVAALWESQADAVAAARAALPAITAAAAAAHARLSVRGRLVYVGAGSSGRIAFQDGIELGPTFGWPDARLVLQLAGGTDALRHAIEGAEDDIGAAQQAAATHDFGPDDVVIGVAASGRTPYTVALLQAARARGALTVAVGNAPGPLLTAAEHSLLAATGAEVIAGSTRLKAGTAQKVALNIFSTLLMVRLGRTYAGRMVDMRPTNDKLRRRAIDMICDVAGCDRPVALAALAAADDSIKVAVLIARGRSAQAARALLARHDDHLRKALEESA